ncbi:hypothetical protein ACODUM_03350 [Stenotrophomonas maltophilia]
MTIRTRPENRSQLMLSIAANEHLEERGGAGLFVPSSGAGVQYQIGLSVWAEALYAGTTQAKGSRELIKKTQGKFK